MKQRRWNIRGWTLMLTWGQAFAIGIHTGWGWIPIRVNGFSILLGPLAIDIQPPPPAWLTNTTKFTGDSIEERRL